MEDIESLLQQAKVDFDNYKNLPMPVYISTAEGDILKYNKELLTILKLSNQTFETLTLNIADYYFKKESRQLIISKLKKLKSSEWLTDEILELKIAGLKMIFRYWSRPYFNGSSEHVGHLCILSQMTEFEAFKHLEDMMPIGLFEVDEHGNFSANKKCLELLKIDPTQNLNLKAADFFQSKDDFKELFNQIKNNKTEEFIKQRVTLLNGDDILFIANLYIKIEFNERNRIEKIKGFLENVTFDSIRREAPIGVYLSMKNKYNDDVIMNANNQFSNIMGFNYERESEEFYGKLKESEFIKSFDSFVTKLSNAKDGIISNEKFQIINVKKEVKDVLITAKNLKDFNEKNIIGRVAIIYDITGNVNHKLEEWSSDFASLLHSHSSILNSIRDTISVIIEGHNSSIAKSDNVQLINAFGIISENIKALNSNLKNFFQWCRSRNDINEQLVKEIQENLKIISNKDSTDYKERASWIRLICIEIREKIPYVTSTQNLPKEQIKQIDFNISEILRYARLISLDLTKQEIKEALDSIHTFKKSLSFGTLIALERKEINILDVLNNITGKLSNFAASKNLSIVKEYENNDKILLVGARQELHDALYNIIHNAIKYSWIKKVSNKGWIKIQVKDASSQITISIENYGVAIKKVEIDQGLIFKFNYRGANSGDRDRYGWGIGLWQSKKLINAHNGIISVISRPADGVSSDTMTNPFVTIFIVTLPKKYK